MLAGIFFVAPQSELHNFYRLCSDSHWDSCLRARRRAGFLQPFGGRLSLCGRQNTDLRTGNCTPNLQTIWKKIKNSLFFFRLSAFLYRMFELEVPLKCIDFNTFGSLSLCWRCLSVHNESLISRFVRMVWRGKRECVLGDSRCRNAMKKVIPSGCKKRRNRNSVPSCV